QRQKLNSKQAINQCLQQMEAAINKEAQTLSQTAPHSPAGKNDYHLLWLGLGAIVLSAGGLIILFTSSWQKRKIKQSDFSPSQESEEQIYKNTGFTKLTKQLQ
ncbi:8090_t:CDS:2, partial [Entrophospora sp. SA101]